MAGQANQRTVDATPLPRGGEYAVAAGVDPGGNSQPLAISPTGTLQVSISGTSAFLANINAVGTGANGSLELQPTAGLFVNQLATIYVASVSQLEDWLLLASTAANASDASGRPRVIRPLDFDPVLNAKVWFRQYADAPPTVGAAVAYASFVLAQDVVTGLQSGNPNPANPDSTKLESVPTVGLPTGRSFSFYLAGTGLVTFRLFADGTNPGAGQTPVPPLDYNANTNARQWYQIG